MKPETVELAHYRMQKALQTAEEARILFENGKYNGAMNRIYYSIFYAASALLILDGLSSAKHSGTISLFLQNFVKNNRVPEATGMFLKEAFKHRSRGDYDDFAEFSESQIGTALEQLDKHLSSIQELMTTMTEEQR